jgi:hypothetical protein
MDAGLMVGSFFHALAFFYKKTSCLCAVFPAFVSKKWQTKIPNLLNIFCFTQSSQRSKDAKSLLYQPFPNRSRELEYSKVYYIHYKKGSISQKRKKLPTF